MPDWVFSWMGIGMRSMQVFMFSGLHVVLQPTATPKLETPEYTVLYKTSDFEVRNYPSFLVAETPMPPGSGAASGSGFQELAGYIFGGNEAKQNMEMTTPVFNKPPAGTGEPGKMQFVMERRFSAPESLPTPKKGTKVESKVEEGGIVAAYTFSGWPFDTEVRLDFLFTCFCPRLRDVRFFNHANFFGQLHWAWFAVPCQSVWYAVYRDTNARI